MACGKTIKVYLVDGTPNGLQTVELSNWTGKGVVCQRSQLHLLARRPEAKRTGVYILLGPDPEAPPQECAYIGEGDSVLDRLRQHDQDADKDFWTAAVIFVSKDENLTKAHARYLEAELIRRASEARRVQLVNQTRPETKQLPEPDVADMQFFLEQIELILPVLSFNLLRPIPKLEQLQVAPESESAEVSPIFEMHPKGTHAFMRQSDREFIILHGSTASTTPTSSWTSYRQLRDRLVKEQRLVPDTDGDFLCFAEDVAFASPSAAAAVVFAGNQNGPLTWKIQGTDTTYRQWKEEQVRAAVALGTDQQLDVPYLEQ